VVHLQKLSLLDGVAVQIGMTCAILHPSVLELMYVEFIPCSSNNSRPSSAAANRNPLRSNNGPRVTGFRDLAASSSAGPSFGGGGGGGGRAASDDEDERKDPQNFYTGGAKSYVSFSLSQQSHLRELMGGVWPYSGLSVENPDNQQKGGAHGDMIKNILQQAKE